MDVWPRICDADLANLLGNLRFLRQQRTLLEGYPRTPTSTAKRSTVHQFSLMVWTCDSYLLDFTKCHLSIFSSHGQVSSMIMTCLSDGEYIKMSGRSAVRVIWIGNAYCLLPSVATFQSLGKNKIPYLLVVLFSGGVIIRMIILRSFQGHIA